MKREKLGFLIKYSLNEKSMLHVNRREGNTHFLVLGDLTWEECPAGVTYLPRTWLTAQTGHVRSRPAWQAPLPWCWRCNSKPYNSASTHASPRPVNLEVDTFLIKSPKAEHHVAGSTLVPGPPVSGQVTSQCTSGRRWRPKLHVTTSKLQRQNGSFCWHHTPM